MLFIFINERLGVAQRNVFVINEIISLL